MYFFKGVDNNNIPFESLDELSLSLTTINPREILTYEITLYFIDCNNKTYLVSEETYKDIKRKKEALTKKE